MKAFCSKNIHLSNYLFSIRQQGSFVGFILGILSIVIQTLVYSFLTKKYFDNSFHFSDILLATIGWSFFATSTMSAVKTLSLYKNLIRNTRYNWFDIIFSRVNSIFVSTLLEYIIFILFIYFFFKTDYSLNLLGLSQFVFLLYLLTIAMSSILSIIYLRKESVEPIWSNFLKIFFFVTPIFYPISMIDKTFHSIFLFNPVALLIIKLRGIEILNGYQIDFILYGFVIAITLILLMLILKSNKLEREVL